jgi:hypothetical protein
VDKVFLNDLWRAVDQHGHALDILVQRRIVSALGKERPFPWRSLACGVYDVL